MHRLVHSFLVPHLSRRIFRAWRDQAAFQRMARREISKFQKKHLLLIKRLHMQSWRHFSHQHKPFRIAFFAMQKAIQRIGLRNGFDLWRLHAKNRSLLKRVFRLGVSFWAHRLSIPPYIQEFTVVSTLFLDWRETCRNSGNIERRRDLFAVLQHAHARSLARKVLNGWNTQMVQSARIRSFQENREYSIRGLCWRNWRRVFLITQMAHYHFLKKFLDGWRQVVLQKKRSIETFTHYWRIEFPKKGSLRKWITFTREARLVKLHLLQSSFHQWKAQSFGSNDTYLQTVMLQRLFNQWRTSWLEKKGDHLVANRKRRILSAWAQLRSIRGATKAEMDLALTVHRKAISRRVFHAWQERTTYQREKRAKKLQAFTFYSYTLLMKSIIGWSMHNRERKDERVLLQKALAFRYQHLEETTAFCKPVVALPPSPNQISSHQQDLKIDVLGALKQYASQRTEVRSMKQISEDHYRWSVTVATWKCWRHAWYQRQLAALQTE